MRLRKTVWLGIGLVVLSMVGLLVVAEETYTITASAASGGSISPSGPQTPLCDEVATFTVTPDPGWGWYSTSIIGNWTVWDWTAEVGLPGTLRAQFACGSSGTIEVHFARVYTITATAGAGGSIHPSGARRLFEGEGAGYLMFPDHGYHVRDVVVDDTTHLGATPMYIFNNVQSNHRIDVVFELNTYTITATAGSGGSLTPLGVVSVDYGGTQVFSIVSRTGYHVTNVLVDGKSQGQITSFTFDNVAADHTIRATFAEDVLVFIPAYPPTNENQWSLLTRPVPTTVNARGMIERLPVVYSAGEPIAVRFLLEDGRGHIVKDADIKLTLWKYEGTTGWPIRSFDVPYARAAKAYQTVIPTEGPDFTLSPGFYQWRLVTRTGKELERLDMRIE